MRIIYSSEDKILFVLIKFELLNCFIIKFNSEIILDNYKSKIEIKFSSKGVSLL